MNHLQLLRILFFLVFSFSLFLSQTSGCSRRVLSQNTIPATGICATSVIKQGYKCQEIHVTTQDGFILNVQRISQGSGGVGSGIHQPVIMQHGILADGMAWLFNSPQQNLPMILADSGFDVWIVNTRGTRFSRRHISLQPTDREFWNWSWDELATYDLPAVFNYVQKQTGQKSHYVGHSLGTLTIMASISEGLLNEKVKSVVLLSPIAYLSHMKAPLAVVAADAFVGELTQLLGSPEFNPAGDPVRNFIRLLCHTAGIYCYDMLTAITGPNCCLNSSTLDLFLKNEPQSTSTKNMVHLAQTVRDGVIAKYNYGFPLSNVMAYGDASPPVYNFSNVPRELPMMLSYGGNDALSDGQDVTALLNKFKAHDARKRLVVNVTEYAHLDFIMGTTAKDRVYRQIVSFFNNRW